MSEIYHQSLTDGRKSNVLAQDGIFLSMLKNLSVFDIPINFFSSILFLLIGILVYKIVTFIY